MNKSASRPAQKQAASAKPKPAPRARTSRPAGARAASKPATPPSRTAAKPALNATTKSAATIRSAPPKQAAVPGKSAAAVKAAKPAKAKKVKLVRDSFTMPENEYALIAAIKKRCLGCGIPAKKSEILRAAIAGLAKLTDTSVVSAIRRLPVVKTGRPAKGSK